MLEKLFDMKPIGWNNPSSCCCDRMAPVVKLDALHSRWKGPDLNGKASAGAEVTVLFSASKACYSAAPHDQSFDLQVSMEGASNPGEVTDESPVEVHESYKGLNVLYLFWLWPVCDSLDLDRVHCYMVFRNDEPEIVHLSTFELTFLWLGK